jgi:UDP-glucose 4-epimerase
MSAVISIFLDQYLHNKKLTVVSPGIQRRRFTHVKDTVHACYMAWKRNKNAHYSIASSKDYSIIEVAKLLSNNIKYLPERRGERFKSNVIKSIRGKKIINLKSFIKLNDYLDDFKKKINSFSKNEV